MNLERQKAYVERLPNGIEIGTRHDPVCAQPWDVTRPDSEIAERSLTDTEEACHRATLAIEMCYSLALRALWYIERSPWVRKWLRRLRLFRPRPYQYRDPVTHRGDNTVCRWLCFITVHNPADVAAGAIAAERYLYDRGYQIVEKF